MVKDGCICKRKRNGCPCTSDENTERIHLEVQRYLARHHPRTTDWKRWTTKSCSSSVATQVTRPFFYLRGYIKQRVFGPPMPAPPQYLNKLLKVWIQYLANSWCACGKNWSTVLMFVAQHMVLMLSAYNLKDHKVLNLSLSSDVQNVPVSFTVWNKKLKSAPSFWINLYFISYLSFCHFSCRFKWPSVLMRDWTANLLTVSLHTKIKVSAFKYDSYLSILHKLCTFFFNSAEYTSFLSFCSQ